VLYHSTHPTVQLASEPIGLPFFLSAVNAIKEAPDPAYAAQLQRLYLPHSSPHVGLFTSGTG